MSSNSIDIKESQASPQLTPDGIFRVKVPHWLIQIRIFDNAYNLKALLNEFNPSSDTANYFEAETRLKPGIYEIEIALADKVERQLVSIKPEKTTYFELSEKDWKSIQIISPIPLDYTLETETEVEKQIAFWSVKTTKRSSQGDAHVFLCVQVPQENRSRKPFTDYGLLQAFFDLKRIADPGQINSQIDKAVSVINFKKDLIVLPGHKTVFFTAELPAGFYILEWINERKIKNYQPVYLHRNWSTQLFVLTHTPASKAFSLNMSRMGEPFHRNDETAMAAETVLATLNQEVRGSLLTKDKMKILLWGEDKNPWLGVLAGYALIPSISSIYEETKMLDPDSEKLLADIRSFLKQQLPDHPDVQALLLEPQKAAEQPFYFPPLIYKGLKRVKLHAERFESSIPYYSFTDYVLNTTLIDGPWVNWEASKEPGTEANSKKRSGLTETARSEVKQKAVVDLAGAVSSKAPIFKVSTGTSLASQVQGSLATLQEATLINIAQEITKTNYTELPEKYSLNLVDSLVDTLSTIKPVDISLRTGLPLSRVSAGISSVLEKQKQLSDSNNKSRKPVELSYDEQLIIKYAMQAADDDNLAASPIVSNDAFVNQDDSFTLSAAGISDSITIEECIARLRAEKSRILLGVKEKSKEYNQESQNFAERLQTLINELLKGADFMVITNSNGKITHGNGAFINMISSTPDSQSEMASIKSHTFYKIKKRNIQRNLAPWEAALQTLPPGKTLIPDPAGHGLFNDWEVRRSQVQEQSGGVFDGYLNIIRGKDAPSFLQENMQMLGDLLCRLEVYTPLYALHSVESKNQYSGEIQNILLEMEKLAS